MASAHYIPICCVCSAVRDDARKSGPTDQWSTLNQYLDDHGLKSGDYRLTHTYCDFCAGLLRNLHGERKQEREGFLRSTSASNLGEPGGTTITARINDMLAGKTGCELDSLVRAMPDLTWNQVFSEVDRLSRAGRVRMTYLGRGRYEIELGRVGGTSESLGPHPS
ncbi:MAG: hypothetical protein KF814_00775 [Nitrospiraceae bacterium]|nr:hypothetical protein [Nitrospiraceae bacterium]